MAKQIARRKGKVANNRHKLNKIKFHTGLNFLDSDLAIDERYPEFKAPWFKYKRSNLSGFKTKLGQYDVIKLENNCYIPYIEKYWTKL
jgi:hypothetical protein